MEIHTGITSEGNPQDNIDDIVFMMIMVLKMGSPVVIANSSNIDDAIQRIKQYETPFDLCYVLYKSKLNKNVQFIYNTLEDVFSKLPDEYNGKVTFDKFNETEDSDALKYVLMFVINPLNETDKIETPALSRSERRKSERSKSGKKRK